MNKHINMASDAKDSDERLMERAFKNGVAMAFYSMGKFKSGSSDEEAKKLREIQDILYNDFLNMYKYSLLAKENNNGQTEGIGESASEV